MSESTLHSGEAGTTGREVFEHHTAKGPGPGYGKDAGESATTGFEGSDGVGAGGHVHHHHDTSGGPPAVTGSEGHSLVGGTAGAGGRQSEGADPHANTGASLPGTAGTGGGVPPPSDESTSYQSGGGGHHHHHHHAEGAGVGAGSGAAGTDIGGHENSQLSENYGSNTASQGATGVQDRVGSLNQGGAMYERTTDQGPVTTGAAGTDRFDTQATGQSYPDIQESTTRAEGKSSGAGSGLMGIIGTSDKDFTGRDRLGGASGAYADTEGRFANNTTGPGGNSALTGREGTIENNPVAQASGKMSSANDSDLVSSTGQGTGKDENMLDEHGAAPKQGFAEKLKGFFTA